MTHHLTLQAIRPVTHDTHRLLFDKPENFEFEPGQATDLALDKDGWRDEARPFTFTSLPDDGHLEFIIKSYPAHDGVTQQIGKMQPGDTVLIGDPWGAIEDQGPGWFIAGGAGITPFVSILRARLKRNGTLRDCSLLFSNKTEADIILREEFEQMSGLSTVFTVTDQKDTDLRRGMIDADFLTRYVEPGQGKCYVCGPDPMLEDIGKALRDIGVAERDIVTEVFD